jgi:heat shock protein HslJ
MRHLVHAVLLALMLFSRPVLGRAQEATPPPAGSAIPPIVWELVAYTGGGGEPVAIDDPARYSLQFLPEGELLALLDCNRGRGTYVAADGMLTISPLATTRAACPPESHDMSFLRLLTAATRFAFDADGCLLLGGDQGELRLRPAAGAA